MTGGVSLFPTAASRPDPGDWFSQSHTEATARFLEAARLRSALVEHFPHPLAGPQGETVETLCACIGSADAARVAVVISGTHGLEGLPGAGCQLALMADLAGRDRDTAWLFVHLLNCWGTAWSHRHDETNVDVNRNFVDFSAPPRGDNPAYRRMHGALLGATAGLSGADLRHAIERFIATTGIDACASTLMRGQHQVADGSGYGGRSESWSRQTLETILARHALRRDRVLLIDLHTGLGPFGDGVIISTAPAPSSELARLATSLGGDFVALADPNVLPYTVAGDLCSGARSILPGEVTAVALEFGTYPVETLLALQLEDQLQPAGVDSAALQRRLRDFFYPDDPVWKARVVARTLATIDRLLQR